MNIIILVLRLKLTNISCHLFRAYFRKISGHDAVVKRVEHAHEPRVHPSRGLRVEDKVESHKGGKHCEVAKDANNVANFVD